MGGYPELLDLARVARGLEAPRADRRLARRAQDLAEALDPEAIAGGGAAGRVAPPGAGRAAIAAITDADPRGVLRLWLSAPDTRAVLLTPGRRRYGLGRAGPVWVLVVDAPVAAGRPAT